MNDFSRVVITHLDSQHHALVKNIRSMPLGISTAIFSCFAIESFDALSTFICIAYWFEMKSCSKGRISMIHCWHTKPSFFQAWSMSSSIIEKLWRSLLYQTLLALTAISCLCVCIVSICRIDSFIATVFKLKLWNSISIMYTTD